MSATLLTQLETAETIPAGSLYMMEAGDGSGTKTVTQETLEQKMGQALKVGDLTELATEEKETLVGAINEAAQSGGGAAVDVLDSREEIEANTQSGKSAGALAVKEMVGELNSKISEIVKISIVTGNIPEIANGENYTVSIQINPPNGYKALGIGAISNEHYSQSLLSHDVDNNNILRIRYYNSYGKDLGAYPNGVKATVFFLKA